MIRRLVAQLDLPADVLVKPFPLRETMQGKTGTWLRWCTFAATLRQQAGSYKDKVQLVCR